MRCALPCVLLASAMCAFGQNANELIAIQSDTVIAKINGVDLTAGEFERMIQKLSPSMHNLAAFEPAKFLEQHAFARTLIAQARAAGLDKQDPYRKQIEDFINQTLTNAAIAEKRKSFKVTDEELRKIYDSRIDQYTQASVKVIFISRATFTENVATGAKETTRPEDAKEKAAKVAKLAREGKDFAELAKQFSDDATTAAKGADFPFPIRTGAGNVPLEIRTAILAARPGDIVGPMEEATGYYLFRVESSGPTDFASVRESIENEVRSTKVNEWMEEMRKKAVVTLDHKPFWDTFVAANKAAREQREKAASGESK